MKLLIVVSLLVGMISCSPNKYEDIDQLAWLRGKWGTDIQGKEMTEEWVRLNDSTILGSSYLMENKDTLFEEQMTIATRNGITFFQTIITTKEEEDVDTTRFEMIELEEGKIIFENLFHDFPQRITYTHPSKDSLWAYIDGDQMGNYQRIDFKLKRRK